MPSVSSYGIYRFLEESNPGEIASGNPQIWRVLSGTLNQSVEYSENKELRSDRGRYQSTPVSGSVAGSINVNLSHKTHDLFLEALLSDTFTAVGTNSLATVANMVFDSVTHAITSATAALPLLEKGQWFKISGASNALNNGFFRASNTTAPTTSSIIVDTAVKDVTTATTASTVISSARLKQGNDDPRTITIERELSDVDRFFTWAECHVGSMNLSYSIGSEVSGSFGFMAGSPEATGADSDFPGIASAVAATTTPVFNNVTGTTVLMDGASLGESCAESFTLDINANLKERRCLGAGLAPSSIGDDQFTITGTANIFFGSAAANTIYDKKLTGASMAFSICITDSAGNGFAVTIPAATVEEATVSGDGMGTDVMMSVKFTAYTDTVSGSMICIDRLGSTA